MPGTPGRRCTWLLPAPPGAYGGKWVVAVDDDIDPANLTEVLWAMTTRFDPVEDIDIIRKAWSTRVDPLSTAEEGLVNNRILIDACVPFQRRAKGDFPAVVDLSPALADQLKAKFAHLLAKARP